MVLLLGNLLVQEKEMQENELKEPQRGEGMQVVLGEELHEELAGDLQEDVRQYDAKRPPIFYSISLNHFEILASKPFV